MVYRIKYSFFLVFMMLSCVASFATMKQDTIVQKEYPVVLKLDTVFVLKNRLASLSAQERAKLVSEKLARLAENMMLVFDSIKVVKSDFTSDIVYKDEVIVSITNTDAKVMEMTPDELAMVYRNIIVDVIKKNKEQIYVYELVKKIALGFIIIIVSFFLIRFLNKKLNQFINYVVVFFSLRVKAIKIREYELLDSTREVFILRKLLDFVKYFILFLIVYFTFPFIFRLFPWTKHWSGILINFILKPVRSIFISIINFIPNFITIIVLVISFVYLNKLLKYFVNEIESGKLKINGFYSDWAKPTYNLVRFVIYAFMVVVIWPFIPGSESDIFKGVSVFLGLLISFGSSTAIGNIVAGMVITYMRPFKIGDRVKIGDITGDIIEKAFLVTRLKTIKNEIITIPNGSILTGNTVNYTTMSKTDGLIIHVTVSLGYEVPWEKVHAHLIKAALACDGVIKEKSPFVFQTNLKEWSVSYQINAYVNDPSKMAQVYSDLYQNIQDIFNDNEIEIISPHYQIMRDDITTIRKKPL